MKHYSLMRFPDCRFKCVTLSYDDGNKDDIRLVEIMNYYGLKPRDDNWSLIENFAKYIGKKDDIWYATNGELYDYVKAFDNLEWSADGHFVYNPSLLTVCVSVRGRDYEILSGKTVEIL